MPRSWPIFYTVLSVFHTFYPFGSLAVIRDFCYSKTLWFSLPKQLSLNFRLICCLASIKTVVSAQLRSFLKIERLLGGRQYEYQSVSSAADLLAFVSNSWSASLDDPGGTHSMPLKISKAFDQFFHKRLLLTFGLPRPQYCGRQVSSVSEPFLSELMRFCPTHFLSMRTFPKFQFFYSL